MGREAHQIDFQRRQVDIDFAGGLSCIDVEKNTFTTEQFTDLGNGLHHANFVINGHDGYKNRIRTQCRFQCRQINQTIGQDIEVRDFKTLTFQLTHRIEHGLVFGFQRNEVFTLTLIKISRTLDGQIVGFSST